MGYAHEATGTFKREMERYHAFELRDNALQRVIHLEHIGSFDPSHRWTPTSAQWMDASGLRNNRDINRILDELERGALSRAMELEKVALPGTSKLSLPSTIRRYY